MLSRWDRPTLIVPNKCKSLLCFHPQDTTLRPQTRCSNPLLPRCTFSIYPPSISRHRGRTAGPRREAADPVPSPALELDDMRWFRFQVLEAVRLRTFVYHQIICSEQTQSMVARYTMIFLVTWLTSNLDFDKSSPCIAPDT
ncbi:hypothetical protein HBH64_033990 [Parastagonospora nodorum]|nr:hypothetical protein HBH49_067820 [Parastagonospora nodorum]KAH4131031.1 hypothetical protein HBH47_016000 [Parastagonospora nodorum]KAH4379022.1 hypothetical protein HBH94_077520 [Parastagonospora nodorum]KAH4472137.1 hypothetical protein HBH90_044100 [Parastagonospora nodorum]KAH4485240.1 hypothetical protein HBH88_139170 [Parastagonospora nodorum]